MRSGLLGWHTNIVSGIIPQACSCLLAHLLQHTVLCYLHSYSFVLSWLPYCWLWCASYLLCTCAMKKETNKTRGRGMTFTGEVVPVTKYQYNASYILSGGITQGAWVGGQKVLPLGHSGVITLQILCQAPELG